MLFNNAATKRHSRSKDNNGNNANEDPMVGIGPSVNPMRHYKREKLKKKNADNIQLTVSFINNNVASPSE